MEDESELNLVNDNEECSNLDDNRVCVKNQDGQICLASTLTPSGIKTEPGDYEDRCSPKPDDNIVEKDGLMTDNVLEAECSGSPRENNKHNYGRSAVVKGGCETEMTSLKDHPEDILDTSKQSDSEDTEFVCTKEGCLKKFKTKRNLNIHICFVHVERKHRCSEEQCEKMFRTSRSLKEHQKHVHPFRKVEDSSSSEDDCDQSFIPAKKMICPEPRCGKKFRILHHFINHHAMHMTDRICLEEDCGKCFKTKKILKHHIRAVHCEKMFKCKETNCGKMFKTSANLKEHQAVHTTVRNFICPENGCGAAFQTKDRLCQHKRSVHQEKAFKCPEADCGKMFRIMGHLKEHLSVHNTNRNFICSEEGCAKSYKTKTALTQHIRNVHKQMNPKHPLP